MRTREPTEAEPPLFPGGDWMQLSIRVPHHIGTDVLRFLRRCHWFSEIDYCVMGRPEFDGAQVQWGPTDPAPVSDYAC